ncbi:energy transducer TonB [uncultured Marinobacter sp.]|uniref:energy transducer TonB n=1 Tax=uncultured Marinobacter sp. TaxID=187379 RepID=UPI0030DA1028
MAVQVTATDRLTFTIFMALVLHAVLLLGITFAPESPQASAQTMEITLSRFDDEAPDDADFLAQTSQQGSGSEEERLEQTSPEMAEVNAPVIDQVQPEPPAVNEPPADPERELVQTVAPSQQRAPDSRPAEQPPEEQLPVAERRSLMERSLEIASLEARLDAQRQAYARRPRVTRITAASTLQSSNAWYVQDWVSRVTRVGNLNYPPEARERSIYGDLRMLVSLRKDGTIKQVSILESSGSPVLDDAAIRIVRMAAPFAPFPDEMREETDELEIIRTWSFQRRGLSSG